MSRIVSVWLPRWPIRRFLAAQAIHPKVSDSATPVDPDRPLVLAVVAAGGPRIAALNEAAEAAGLCIGEPLADARAKAGPLQIHPFDAAADDVALRRLALWATRYTPTASPLSRDLWHQDNGADGFFLDIEGAAHLFGGEEKLIADLALRLNRFGLPARLAVAATPGAAWALSRFHQGPLSVLPSGREAEALAPLPIAALRLSAETRGALRRLGLKTVGALIERPRAPFAARFAAELLRRLDQALGRVEEPLIPIVAPPVYHSLHYPLEPLMTQEVIVGCAGRLMQNLIHVLERDDVGARALRLCLYRVDGAVETIEIGLAAPTRSASHVARLLELKLEALAAMDHADFGFEAVGLAVTRAEPMPARQREFAIVPHPEMLGRRPGPEGRHPASSFEGHRRWPPQDEDRAERCAALIDALRQRLGPGSVMRFASVASHIPERAERLVEIDAAAQLLPHSEEAEWPPAPVRPLLLLPQAEPADVTALVPDGPPRRFCWRGVTYDVGAAQGPERIGAEWWRESTLSARSRESRNPDELESRLREDERQQALTRDYYLVEDLVGQRFWLYREGLYGRETTAARWFVQGLFA